jgi:hypothetical protein
VVGRALETVVSTGSLVCALAVVGWRLMTWLLFPVICCTFCTSEVRLSAGALISTPRLGTSPSRPATVWFTTASTPGTLSAADPPNVSEDDRAATAG